MEIWKNIILVCYIIALLLEAAGITIVVLAGKKRKSKRNSAMQFFMGSLLVMSLYDLLIYYSNYKIGSLGDGPLLRIGVGIIATLFFLWINLQRRIEDTDEFANYNLVVMIYTFIYATFWITGAFIIPKEVFYWSRWMLLASDIAFILLVMVGSIIYIVKSVLAQEKYLLSYMVVVTTMLTWNFLSYSWGESSVYWGNGKFVREPLDLTIIFWLAVNVANIYILYILEFCDAYKEKHRIFDPKERLVQVAEQFSLTTREGDLVRLIYDGRSNGEIAKSLFISESTVKTHIYNIYKKLDIRNRGGINRIVNGVGDEGSKPN